MRGLAVLGSALAGSLLFCASGWAKTVPELTLTVQPAAGGPVGVLSPSLAKARAIQNAGAPGELREPISITSATPSVCLFLGYVWGPGEEQPAEREMVAQIWVGGVAPGTCTLVASVAATSTTEAAEATTSFKVISTPPPPEPPQPPKLPEIKLGEGGPEEPRVIYLPLPGSFTIEAQASRPGLGVFATTPSVCSVSPLVGQLKTEVHVVSTGLCTIAASLPKTPEHEAVEVTKSSS